MLLCSSSLLAAEEPELQMWIARRFVVYSLGQQRELRSANVLMRKFS